MNRNRIAVILLFSSFFMWLAVISTVRVSILTEDNFWGILSKLPFYHWLSIFLVVGAIKLTYDCEHKSLFLIALTVLFLILFGTYPFIEPNGRHGASYYPSAMAKQIVLEGRLSPEFSGEAPLANPYTYYPVFQIMAATFTIVTSISLDMIVRYFIFSMLIPVFLVFYSSKMLLRNSKLAVLASLCFLSFSTSHLFFTPFYASYLFIFLFLYVFIKMEVSTKRAASLNVFLIIFFVAMNLITVLPPFAVIAFLFTFALFNLSLPKGIARWNLLLLLSVIFSSWMIYVAFAFFNGSILELLSHLQYIDIYLGRITSGQMPKGSVTLSEAVTSYVIFGFIILNFSLSSISVVRVLAHKEYRNKKQYLMPMSYFVATLLLLLTYYGGEIVGRVHTLSLATSVFLIPLLFEKRKYVIFSLLCVLLLLHPVAYAGRESYLMITNSELAGARFFIEVSTKEASFFSQGSRSIIYYQDPYRAFRQKTYTLWYPVVRDFDINWNFEFLIYSERDHNGLLIYLGSDPIMETISERDFMFNEIYNNGYLQIYSRRG
jgi:hypothetical protein